MKDFQFHPSCFKARSSQSIHIVNEDSALHNFSITGTGIDVDVAGGKDFNGESAGLDPGTYQFFCKYHKSSGMVGEVTVLSG
jgi:plastocyanin